MAGPLLRIALLFSVASASQETVTVGQTFLASSQDPTDDSAPWALVSHGIAEKLFTFDSTGSVVPQIASNYTKVDDYTWTVSLANPFHMFSDGQWVIAEHIVTSLTTQNTDNTNGNDALGEMTVTKVDDNTVQIVTTIAHPSIDVALANWVFVIFLQSGDDYIYSGPFMVDTFTADEQIELVPNTHYTDGPDFPVTIKKYSSDDALADALIAGEVDLAFQLSTDNLADVEAVDGLTTKSFESSYQYMMFHNMRTGRPLSELNVRKAVDVIIDRKALRQALAGGWETRSLFAESTIYYKEDVDSLEEDLSEAETLLDAAGWLLEDGKRMKNGAELTLELYSYPFRPDLGIMRPLIQASLESLGITVTGGDVCFWDGTDASAAILADYDYDLLLWAQQPLPSGDPQWFLNAFFRGNPMDSRNYAGINSTTIDSLLDALAIAETADNARVDAALAVHTEILNEYAVSSLLTPEWHVGLSSKLADYVPYGADYYVVRSDLTVITSAPTPAPTSDEGEDSASGAGRGAVLGGLLAAVCLLPLAAA